MPNFVQTVQPTPYSFFDSDAEFQSEADGVVTWIRRRLGDDVLSVELTKLEIWACLEEAVLEYSRLIHEFRMKNELVNVLGLPTGSTDLTNRYPRPTLEYLVRLAEPYSTMADVGGSYDATLGYIEIETNRQDYNIYTELKHAAGPNQGEVIFDTLPEGSRGKLRLVEVFHFEPLAAQQFLLNASNLTNFLATNFNYESYVNSTIFYVLPVFEDVLRRQMLETAFRVRRSGYSYEIIGTNLRIYPIPITNLQVTKLFVKVSAGQMNPLVSSGSVAYASGVNGVAYTDDSMAGISGPNNFPVDNLPYNTITSPGRQWVRQFTLALCREMLGLIRSKFDAIPVPNAEVKLNGEILMTQAREDLDKLREQLKEFLGELTHDKLIEREVNIAENIQKQMKLIPMPAGRSIFIG